MCPTSQEAARLVTDFQNDRLLNVYGFVTIVTVIPSEEYHSLMQ